MNRIGVIKYNVSDYSLDELLRWCSENGVEYVELMRKDVWEDVEKSEHKIKEVSELLRKHKIKLSQISCGNNFVQESEEDFNKQVKMVATLCKMVKDLGFNQLRLDGGGLREGLGEQDYRSIIMDGVKKVMEVAEKEGVYIALDNHGRLTNDYRLQLDIFTGIKSQYLGANLDTLNYRWFGYPVEELTDIYRKIAPYTFHTHLKDGVVEEKYKYTKRVLGEGEIPLEETIKILEDAGYIGPWCIEYEGEDGIEGYKKSVDWLKKID